MISALESYVRTLEQSPAEEFPWGTLQWLWSGKLQSECRQTLGLARIKPGCRNPRHLHPNCDELLYVLSGEGDHALGERWIRLAAGASIWIPTGVPHQLVNVGSEELVSLIAFSTGDRQTTFLEDG